MSYRNVNSEYENPFRIPTDEEIFILRDNERIRRSAQVAHVSSLPVHDKLTWSSKLRVERFNRPKSTKKKKTTVRKRKRSGRSTSRSTTSSTSSLSTRSRDSRGGEFKQRENMKDFIQRKRKMFLLQMSLDSKKFEVQKLQKLAHDRNKKLLYEEESLVRDSTRFDDFLTENDITANEAIQEADNVKREKRIKRKELTDLKSTVKKLESDILKINEKLSEYRKYKKFLLGLHDDLRRTYSFDPGYIGESSLVSQKSSDDDDEGTTPVVRVKAGDDHDGEEEVMLFTKPNQLLTIFSNLEQENLELMKQAGRKEEQLEETKKKLRKTRKEVNEREESMRTKINQYEKLIEKEQDRLEEINKKQNEKQSTLQPRKMKELNKEILKIYESLGLRPPSSHSDLEALSMLEKIETSIDEMIRTIDDFTTNTGSHLWVAKMIKKIERARRAQVRERNKERLLQAKRVVKSDEAYHDTLDESYFYDSSPGRVKRKLMWRSLPPVDINERDRRKKKVKKKKRGRGKPKNELFIELFGI